MRRTASLVLMGLMSTGLFAADADFTEAQKKTIQTMIHDYIVQQPEVLVEASQSLQKKQQQEMQQMVQKSVTENAKDIFNDPFTVVGNTQGAVTLVEFFDYQCIHCKKMAPAISAVMKQTPNLRVVYKEFPIFGEGSTLAAKAALAASKQHKYQEMHDALLKEPGKLTEAVIMQIAKTLNLNIPQLKKDMNDQDIQADLMANRQLAEKIHLMGTPAFIIASTPQGVYQAGKPVYFIPGAASEASMLELIKKAQA